MNLGNIFISFLNSQTGPKTLHFWAPAANFGFVLQGINDWNRDGSNISKQMQ